MMARRGENQTANPKKNLTALALRREFLKFQVAKG
jgi:hypothetical protein